jgi:hypothetical protein
MCDYEGHPAYHKCGHPRDSSELKSIAEMLGEKYFNGIYHGELVRYHFKFLWMSVVTRHSRQKSTFAFTFIVAVSPQAKDGGTSEDSEGAEAFPHLPLADARIGRRISALVPVLDQCLAQLLRANSYIPGSPVAD